MSESLLDQIQAETKTAMKAGEGERVGALRMLTSALQLDAKEGDGDQVAVLQRERKKRLEAAAAYRDGGSEERAQSEEAEARIIETYLPEQVSDPELEAIVSAAIESSGATSAAEMGKVMGAVMPQVKGRADGKRVSAAVRDQLGA